MKKIMIVAFSMLIVAAFCVSPAMAAENVLTAENGDVAFGGGSTYNLSNKVYIDYSVDDGGNPQAYALGTVHAAGNRSFGTTESTSVIWYKTVTKGTTTPSDTPGEGATSAQFTSDSWTPM